MPASPISSRLAELAVSESGFVFDPRSGQSFTLNETGIVALACLRAGLDEQSAAADLAGRYGRPADLIVPALTAFRRQLERYFQ